jgi:hypothetical protein
MITILSIYPLTKNTQQVSDFNRIATKFPKSTLYPIKLKLLQTLKYKHYLSTQRRNKKRAAISMFYLLMRRINNGQ